MLPSVSFTHKSPPGHIVSVNENLCLLVAGKTRRGAKMTVTIDTHVAVRMIGEQMIALADEVDASRSPIDLST